MTSNQANQILGKNGLYPDKFSKSKGIFTFKNSYFYRHGRTAQAIANKIKEIFPKAKIISAIDDYKRWPAISYFVVKFTIY